MNYDGPDIIVSAVHWAVSTLSYSKFLSSSFIKAGVLPSLNSDIHLSNLSVISMPSGSRYFSASAKLFADRVSTNTVRAGKSLYSLHEGLIV